MRLQTTRAGLLPCVAALLVGLGAAGCGGDEEGGGETTRGAADATTTTTATRTTTATTTATTTETEDDTAPDGGAGGSEGAQQTRSCGDVAYAEQTDHGAFDIRATGVGCDVARHVARAAEGAGPRFSHSGFSCRGRRTGAELPTTAYTCERGGARLRFEVS